MLKSGCSLILWRDFEELSELLDFEYIFGDIGLGGKDSKGMKHFGVGEVLVDETEEDFA